MRIDFDNTNCWGVWVGETVGLWKGGQVVKKKYYKDSYGCRASITLGRNGYRLWITDNYGITLWKRIYKTYRGAKSAMGRQSDSWKEVVSQ